MWLLWSALSSRLPSQQLGKRTCSRRNDPRPCGRVGTVLEGGMPDIAPQLQNVTRPPCGLVAVASPARSSAGCSGTWSPGRACRAGSRSSLPAAGPATTRDRAQEPSTQPCLRGACTTFRRREASRMSTTRPSYGCRRMCAGATPRLSPGRRSDRPAPGGRGAVLDEVDALQVGSRRVTHLRLLARQRGWAEQRGDDRQNAGRGDQDHCSHVNLPGRNNETVSVRSQTRCGWLSLSDL